jgi:hypothetical protein
VAQNLKNHPLRQSATLFGILPVNAFARRNNYKMEREAPGARNFFSVLSRESFISVLISWRILRK